MGIEGGSNGALDLDWQQKGNPPEIFARHLHRFEAYVGGAAFRGSTNKCQGPNADIAAKGAVKMNFL